MKIEIKTDHGGYSALELPAWGEAARVAVAYAAIATLEQTICSKWFNEDGDLSVTVYIDGEKFADYGVVTAFHYDHKSRYTSSNRSGEGMECRFWRLPEFISLDLVADIDHQIAGEEIDPWTSAEIPGLFINMEPGESRYENGYYITKRG